MLSLVEVCQTNIARQIANAPPTIQEMIIETTMGKLRETAKCEAYSKLDFIPDLVSDILEDLIRVMTTDGAVRTDFYGLYSSISPAIIRCAIQTAELIAQQYESKLIQFNYSVEEEMFDIGELGNDDENEDDEEEEEEDDYYDNDY